MTDTLSTTPNRGGSIGRLIGRLTDLARRFTPTDVAEKEHLLEEIQHRTIRNAASLFQYHETLCFMRAYPDNPKVLQLVEHELQDFSIRVVPVVMKDEGAARKLLNSGIAGTTLEYPYDWDTALWFVEKFPDTVSMDWDAFNDAETDNLAPVLPLLVSWPENDTLDDPDQSTEDWVKLAKAEGQSDFVWFVMRLQKNPLPSAVRRHLYEQLELPLRWRLEDAEVSRSRARLPVSKIVYQQGPISKPEGDLRSEVSKPLPPLKHLPESQAKAIIDHLRAALFVRHRELYPEDHANPAEVFLADLGRGIQVTIIGTEPAFRLPLEADYAALIVKNGLPIGYGVGAVLFDRVEIAINIFDTFRGGEAAYIFAQYLRLFHHHFGATTFLLRRYQVGHENEEGIEAGAYWFYYKLGFRSFDAKAARLAQDEFAKIQMNRDYRTSRSTLRRLALSDMYLCMESSAEPHQELSLSKLGLAITKHIAEHHHGDHIAATRAMTRKLAALLNVPQWTNWPPDEQESFRRLALPFGLIPDLERWSKSEKKALAEIMQAKGKPREINYARGLIAHRRLFEALRKLAEYEK
jgi:hypothetical protein